jgi:photosystem II stability/assembly factor-like uncharacterized protein
MLIGSDYRGILHSNDMNTFEERNTGLTALSILRLLTHNNYIFCTTSNGLYRSIDQGKNWERFNHANSSITVIKSSNDTLVASAGVQGILISRDDGLNWETLPSPSSNNNSNILLSFHHGKIYVSVAGKIQIYNVKTSLWQSVSVGDASDWFQCMTSIGGKMFAGSAQGPNGRIYVSDDNGITWSPTTPITPQGFNIIQMTTVGNSLLVAANGIVFRTDDFGTTWQSYPTGNSLNATYWMDNLNDDLIQSTSGGAAWSSDVGRTWVDISDTYFSTIETHSYILVNDTIFAATAEGVWAAKNDFGPKVTSFSSNSQPVGKAVSLQASYLSYRSDLDSVRVSGTFAPISDSAPGYLQFNVPKGAKSGPLTIKVGAKTTVITPNFCVIPEQPIISETIVQGQSRTLNSNASSGYQWYFNDQPISGANQQTYSPTVNGNYKVQVGITNCLSPFSNDFALPNSSEHTSIYGVFNACTQTQLSYNAEPRNKYQWNAIGGEIVSGQGSDTVTVKWGSGGIGYISALDENENTIIANMVINEKPNKPTISLTDGFMVASQANSYQWFYNGNAIQNGDQQKQAIINPGLYAVQIANAAGCYALSDDFTITGVEGVFNSIATVYPVPTHDKLYLKTFEDSQGEVQLKILDTTGKTIWLAEAELFSDRPYEVDISSLNDGLYILTLGNTVGTFDFKIFKK